MGCGYGTALYVCVSSIPFLAIVWGGSLLRATAAPHRVAAGPHDWNWLPLETRMRHEPVRPFPHRGGLFGDSNPTPRAPAQCWSLEVEIGGGPPPFCNSSDRGLHDLSLAHGCCCCPS